jgi:hypothetical protein
MDKNLGIRVPENINSVFSNSKNYSDKAFANGMAWL